MSWRWNDHERTRVCPGWSGSCPGLDDVTLDRRSLFLLARTPISRGWSGWSGLVSISTRETGEGEDEIGSEMGNYPGHLDQSTSPPLISPFATEGCNLSRVRDSTMATAPIHVPGRSGRKSPRNKSQYRARIICSTDVRRVDLDPWHTVEGTYRRNVDHALKFAGPSVHNGAKADHLDALVELAVQIKRTVIPAATPFVVGGRQLRKEQTNEKAWIHH